MWQGRPIRGARPTLSPWLSQKGTSYASSTNKIRESGDAFTAHSVDISGKLLRYPVGCVPRRS